MEDETVKQWKLLRGAILRRKSGQRTNLKSFEPIAPFNRTRGAELLIRSRDYNGAVEILNGAKKLRQKHPVFDYHLVRSLWGLGRREPALALARRAAKEWQLSFNLYILSLLYSATGKHQLGEELRQRAIKAASAERKDNRLVQVNPFPGKPVKH
jgi:hypothetical protein